LKYTNKYWVNNYNPNKIIHNPKDDEGIQGLNGRVFEGRNGNIIFVPTAGYHYGSNTNGVGSICYLWSSSLYLDYPYDAYYLDFHSHDIDIDGNIRCYGFSIRPVINLR